MKSRPTWSKSCPYPMLSSVMHRAAANECAGIYEPARRGWCAGRWRVACGPKQWTGEHRSEQALQRSWDRTGTKRREKRVDPIFDTKEEPRHG
jgi:hypothetical protein